MYYHWEANTSSIDLKSEMWKPPADMLPLQLATEEDNNNSLMQMQTISNKNSKETGIRYSANLFLTQCPLPDIDQDTDPADTKSIIKWDETIVKRGSTDAPPPDDIPTRRDGIVKNPPNAAEAVSNKPSLKLNIAAAKATAASDIPPYSMNTPDVFKSLSEESGFSLISFVCDVSVYCMYLIIYRACYKYTLI